MNFQRDGFITSLKQLAHRNSDIIFLSADFGAPALDSYIEELPGQYFHMGISEQNMIDVAIGMALKGKQVFCYAMAPFVSLRCAEQHKLAAIMDLPIATLVTGVGLGYANSGPTHYATEDLSLALNYIGSSVYTMCDASSSEECAKYLVQNPEYAFVRLDREPCQDYGEMSAEIFAKGYRKLSHGGKVAVI